MSFTFGTNVAKEATPIRKNYLQAGIHSNCELKDFGIRTTESGNKYVSFEFEQNETGNAAELKIWFPNPDRVLQRDKETLEEAQQREINNAVMRVIHAAEVCTNEALPNITADSFEGLVASIMERIKSKKKHTVKLKLVYDYKGVYPEFSKSLPFLELNTVQPTGLSFTKYEIENRLSKATAPSETIVKKDDSDLPF